MFERVLLCYDGSPASRNALERGAQLAAAHGSRVFVLALGGGSAPSAGVMAGLSGSVCLVEAAEEHHSLQESIEFLGRYGLQAEGLVARGCPIDAIVDHSRRLAVDLIVLGHYPRPAGGRWWSGSERRSLAERVNCCVFIAVNQQ